MAQIQMIKDLARKLNLQRMAVGAIELKESGISNLDFLQSVLQQELNIRGDRAIIKKQKLSKLPQCSFDITRSSGVTSWQINELMQLQWLEKYSNLIITGKSGNGKISLAVKLGVEAIKQGCKTYYISIDTLIDVVKNKGNTPKLQGMHRYMSECDLIIVDEVMYMNLSREDLQLLYKILIFLNETRSIVVITNRALSEWKDAVEDKHLMETLMDRLTADMQILSLDEVFQEVIDYGGQKKHLKK